MSGIRCSRCGASVSSPVPAGTVVRAFVECPECIERVAPSPVTAAGGEQWSGWFCPQCGPDKSVDEDQCCAACGAYCCAMEAVRLVAAGYAAPAPTSAVPGLREWVEDRIAFWERELLAAAPAARQWREQLKARLHELRRVLAEIDRRSPAPSDGAADIMGGGRR